ncbi:MAG: enoyl-CoA hydratase/isomerase family protein [Deltaproteobacteria bacterium]|nr:enoyl-CoA hydratase/isomerase family protein [Deltaproteobacteria bacterium]
MGETSFEQVGGVGVLVLERPERKNALSLALLQELLATTEMLKKRNDVKVLIIKSSSESFCSGHNLKELHSENSELHREIFSVCGRFMLSLQQIPQVAIAQVRGIATAAGCQLVAACDLAIAEEGAIFATPGVKVGIFCTTPSIPLGRTIGPKRALEMLFTASNISATQAQEWGLINEITSAEALELRTMELAQQIASHSAEVLASGKRAFYHHIQLTTENAYQCGTDFMVENLQKKAAKEGIGAFLEKRPPVW